MIAARQIAFGGIDYTAKDYIQDGLVAMWDGIENAGWGVHTDGAVVNLIDPSKSISVPTGDNYWNLGASALSLLEFDYDVITAEFVFRDNARNDCSAWCVGLNHLARGLWFMPTYFYARGYTGTIGGAVPYDGRDYGSLSVVVKTKESGQPTKLYGYGVSLVKDWRTTSTTYEIKKLHALSYGGRNADNYCVRLYNRALTAEEIAHNYEIDKARFGL